MTVAQTMEVVHGLFANMTEVMDGTWIFLEPVRHSVLTVPSRRWKDINKQYPRGARYVWPTCTIGCP